MYKILATNFVVCIGHKCSEYFKVLLTNKTVKINEMSSSYLKPSLLANTWHLTFMMHPLPHLICFLAFHMIVSNLKVFRNLHGVFGQLDVGIRELS